jgi:hypothetical protein
LRQLRLDHPALTDPAFQAEPSVKEYLRAADRRSAGQSSLII